MNSTFKVPNLTRKAFHFTFLFLSHFPFSFLFWTNASDILYSALLVDRNTAGRWCEILFNLPSYGIPLIQRQTRFLTQPSSLIGAWERYQENIEFVSISFTELV